MFPWGNPSTDTRQTWCWRSAVGCDLVVSNLASRSPWDYATRGERDHAHDERQQQQGRDVIGVGRRALPSAPQFMPVSNPQPRLLMRMDE